GARGDRARHRHPRRQVAVIEEVVLGEPYEIESESIEHDHLVHDRGVKVRHVHAGFWRVAEIVDSADAKRWSHCVVLPQFSRAALAITSMASGWRDRTLSESAPLSSQAR